MKSLLNENEDGGPGPPGRDEYAEAHETYVDRVPDGPIMSLLRDQMDQLPRRWADLSGEEWDHRYASGKWSVREVIGHVIDFERIFGYRALAIARSEETDPALPGHDEEEMGRAGGWDQQSESHILEEFRQVRTSNLLMLSRFGGSDWTRTGRADGHVVSVRALAYLMYGHADHHDNVLKERYLNLKG